jgi:osmotically-inducible protein OsmY
MSTPHDLLGASIIDQVQKGLRESGYPALSHVKVIESDGLVTLQGSVPSYYLKQVAQSIALGVEGVRNTANELVAVDRLSR